MNDQIPETSKYAVREASVGPSAGGMSKLVAVCMLLSAIMVSGTLLYVTMSKGREKPEREAVLSAIDKLEAEILPAKGIVLPVRWNGIGAKLIQSGAIDPGKFSAAYASRGGIPQDIVAALQGGEGEVRVTADNSGALLNVLWALGLASKNGILQEGEMADPRYGDPGRFASTGGWTLARGNAMDHYSMHGFFELNPEAQEKVEEVAKNVYRPCCGNSTHFPDCNHGMAMLGLLELMASQGASEEEMYRAALAVNRYWFPDNYLTIAGFLEEKGVDWQKVEPKALLAAEYSSAQGYRQILESAAPREQKSEGSCGV